MRAYSHSSTRAEDDVLLRFECCDMRMCFPVVATKLLINRSNVPRAVITWSDRWKTGDVMCVHEWHESSIGRMTVACWMVVFFGITLISLLLRADGCSIQCHKHREHRLLAFVLYIRQFCIIEKCGATRTRWKKELYSALFTVVVYTTLSLFCELAAGARDLPPGIICSPLGYGDRFCVVSFLWWPLRTV